MFSKINSPEYQAVSNPAENFLHWIRQCKKNKQKLVVAEIGVGIGATTLEILKLLKNGDQLYLFDFKKVLDDVDRSLKKYKVNYDCDLLYFGNGVEVNDCYSWSLAKLAMELKEKNNSYELFDLIYMDAAHSFLRDAAATSVLKLLLKPGGLVLFDDLTWNLGISSFYHKQKEKLEKLFPKDQINTNQVQIVVDLLMQTDPRFQELPLENPRGQGLYRKRFIKS